MVKHAGRTDANHTPIVQSLKSMGYSVQALDAVGKGCPDIMVGVFMKVKDQKIPLNLVFEIKKDEKTAAKVKAEIAKPLSPEDSVQIKWHKTWKGQKAVVATLIDILHIIHDYERGID